MRPVPLEIRQMSVANALQRETLVNTERSAIHWREPRRQEDGPVIGE